ncbi:MAG: hypothetical protein ACK4XJ_09850 [Fimbriimonadaceae bacterium]
MKRSGLWWVALCLAASLGAQTTPKGSTLTVDVTGAANWSVAGDRAEDAMRRFAQNAAQLTSRVRQDRHELELWDPRVPFTLPMRVAFVAHGRPVVNDVGSFPGFAPPASGSFLNGDLTLQFDNSGSRSFPASYRQLLEDVFASARPAMNLIFGSPAVADTVRVLNFDADIPDRSAVAGGIVMPRQGGNAPQIRFPIYNAPEAAAVNFVHCLLLAYLGPEGYAFDAFSEGLVRAATMRVVRTPGAMPATLDPEFLELVLDSTYDVGRTYDWNNQTALGGPLFIAPNLRNLPLPVGQSTGGIYLLRYQMSGSAWQKVLVEYPGLIAALNAELYADPTLAGDVGRLVARAQAIMNAQVGPGATIEGLPFADWFVRQRILETRLSLGQKLLVEPVPIESGLAPPDFGVFLVQAHYFRTAPNGDETLSSGISFPIFWDRTFQRLFPSAQEDRMDIAGAYGSVVPNLPDLEAGANYAATVDIPVQDRLARVFLPAGAIARPGTTISNCYGTVLGATGANLSVRVSVGANVVGTLPVTHGAFGGRIDSALFTGYARCVVEVRRNNQTLLTRVVNKGPGPLALDLRVGGDGTVTLPNLRQGTNAFGLSIEPFSGFAGDVLGVNEATALLARYNASRAAYDLYPDTGGLGLGDGFFARPHVAINGRTVSGRKQPGVPIAVALKPGWNLITTPVESNTPTNRVTVLVAADFPRTYDEAVGASLGATFFEYVPSTSDADRGTMEPATRFEPGKAYFVRVLAATGATLLFSPNGTGGFSREFAMSGTQFHKRLILTGDGMRSTVEIGAASIAKNGFDPSLDSQAPPTVEGIRMTIKNDGDWFRDIRKAANTHRFEASLTGLRPLAIYSIRLRDLAGDPRPLWVTRDGSPTTAALENEKTYRFMATSSTMRFIFERRSS